MGGSMAQLMLQGKAVLVTAIYSAVMSFILLKIIDLGI
jgi:ammonia channel protein AmtB